MHTYKMLIAFDGTNYSGWQVQPNGISIQGLIQKALKVLVKEDVVIHGSGRTDAGVHAIGQIAHFKCHAPLDLFRFLQSLNALLPPDIRVQQMEETSPIFHSRYSAINKTYRYNLHLGRVENPFTRLYSWHIREKIDLDKLKAAANLLIGTHDFTSFINDSDIGSAGRNPVRTMHLINVISDGQTVSIEFKANGFLYKMVRNLTGALVEIGKGKRPVEDIPRLLALKDRSKAGVGAPPHGLFLVQVEY
ncbi:MAG: tRNA pseudouridine(38-40) synthase TruA [Parachlamydiaceae bacterium]|nr:tRNA pseudouridine(38-40) synthase TruA [Parachlamydiaceae bacterium]